MQSSVHCVVHPNEHVLRAADPVTLAANLHDVQTPAVDSQVRLLRDVPELGLIRGQIGAVKAVWCEPLAAFEVEFQCPGQEFPTRALLLKDAIHVVGRRLAANP